MKALILLAGYATRLYPLTLNTPKGLLEINGKPILDYIYDQLETIPEINEVYLVTNDKFFPHFINWKEKRETNKTIKVLNDGTSSVDTRLGAIGDIKFVIDKEHIDDDLMVLAGDNFFTFRLLDFFNFYKDKGKDCVCAHELNDINELKRMGVAVLDKDGKVIHLEEKPQDPKSNFAVYASYIYMKDTLPLFDEYLSSGNSPDAPGYFTAWLYKRKDIYAYIFQGECYDIGTPESYAQVNERFSKEKSANAEEK
jgi:glucose-1-phosphate thymidylyltransferase